MWPSSFEQTSKQLPADVVVVGDQDRFPARFETILPLRAGRSTLGSHPVADVLDQRVLDDLRESVGGDQAFLSELIDELLDDAPRQLETLRQATAAGDGDSARRAAHTLKGNARTFGAAELASLCQEAEAAAAERRSGRGAPPPRGDREAWAQVREALVAVRDGATEAAQPAALAGVCSSAASSSSIRIGFPT